MSVPSIVYLKLPNHTLRSPIRAMSAHNGAGPSLPVRRRNIKVQP